MHGALTAIALVLLGALSECLMAQVYPTKPIRLVVPFAPDGSTDVLGRMSDPANYAPWLSPASGGSTTCLTCLRCRRPG